MYNSPNRQVSSSYVESFGSYRANKQTNKKDKQTDATENIYIARYVTPVGNHAYYRIHSTSNIDCDCYAYPYHIVLCRKLNRQVSHRPCQQAG